MLLSPAPCWFLPNFPEERPIRQAENIIRVLTGLAPWGLANPDALKRIAVLRNSDSARWAGTPDFSSQIAP